MAKKKRLTMEQAIQFINDLRGVEGVNWVSASTIHKKVCSGKIKNYGRKNFGLYDQDELAAEFGEKISA